MIRTPIESQQEKYNRAVGKALWTGHVDDMKNMLDHPPHGTTLQDGVYGDDNPGNDNPGVNEKFQRDNPEELDPNEAHELGETPPLRPRCMLHIAAWTCDEDMLELLLEYHKSHKHSPMVCEDTYKYHGPINPLQVITRKLNFCQCVGRDGERTEVDKVCSVVKQLINHKMDVHVMDKFGRTLIGDVLGTYGYYMRLDWEPLLRILTDANAPVSVDDVKKAVEVFIDMSERDQYYHWRIGRCPGDDGQDMLSRIITCLGPLQAINLVKREQLEREAWDQTMRHRPDDETYEYSSTFLKVVMFGGFKGIEILCDAGENVNRPDFEGDTALHEVCSCNSTGGDPYTALALLKCGADPHAENYKRETPISLIDRVISEQNSLFEKGLALVRVEEGEDAEKLIIDGDKDPMKNRHFEEEDSRWGGAIPEYCTRKLVFAEFMKRFFKIMDDKNKLMIREVGLVMAERGLKEDNISVVQSTVAKIAGQPLVDLDAVMKMCIREHAGYTTIPYKLVEFNAMTMLEFDMP
jgi:hypothetical protein